MISSLIFSLNKNCTCTINMAVNKKQLGECNQNSSRRKKKNHCINWQNKSFRDRQ